MKVAAIQLSPGTDPDKNTERAIEMAEAAAERGAVVIAYPELVLSPWFPAEERRDYFSHARPGAAGSFSPFCDFSKRTDTVLVIPFFESAQGVYFNSSAVIDQGEFLGVYRKIHLPDLPLYREQFYFSPGNAGFPVFETSKGKIGVQMCWDNLFPEGSRILALKGAELIIAPTAASHNTHKLWEKAITANAFANNLHILRVNRVGQEGALAFYGRSFCADPWGDLVSEIGGAKEAVVLADIDRRERESAIETWGFLNHRRPAEYGDVLK